MTVLEARSSGHWCEAPCSAATCDCPPCDCADCRRRRQRAETQPLGELAAVGSARREPVQLTFDPGGAWRFDHTPNWMNDDGREAGEDHT